MKRIIVYGAGGFAREVAWLVQSCNVESENYRVVAFVDDDLVKRGMVLNDIPVMSLTSNSQTLVL